MEKIVKYDVVTTESLPILVEKINKKISSGWQPFGDIKIHIVTSITPHMTLFIQAIIMKEQ